MARYKSGQSGNPAGRPRGSKDKRTELRDLLRPHAPALIEKLIAMALEGDHVALKLCIDRLVSPARAGHEPVTLPKFTGTLSERGEQLLDSLRTGKLAPAETNALLQALAAQAKIKEIDELEQRIQALEAQDENASPSYR